MKALFLLVILSMAFVKLRGADSEDAPFDLTTIYGETYHHCRLFKVTPAAVTVVHDNGVAKISFALLSDSWKDRYNYDPEEAREFLKKDAARQKAAEARRRERQKRQEQRDDEMMKQLAAVEKKDIDTDYQQRKAMAQAGIPLPPLASLPGEEPAAPSTPAPSNGGSTVVPMLPPVGDPYTPINSPTPAYIVPPGCYYIDPFSGAAYVQPGYDPGYPYVGTYVPGAFGSPWYSGSNHHLGVRSTGISSTVRGPWRTVH